MVAAALAEFVVGGYRIGGPSLWRDEAATISGSQRPAGAIWALMRNQDAVHGAYYFLIHVVIGAGGTSEAVLRLPSLIAMSLAAGLTAALGTRLARASDLPAPRAVGLVAGLMLAAVPLTTRYAQEARPYALTTLFAVLATYLLVGAVAETGAVTGAVTGARGHPGARRSAWWAGYAAALVLTGLFNLFAVLLAVGHGVSLLVAGRTARPTGSPASASTPAVGTQPLAGATGRWLISCVVAAIVLAPVAAFSVSQSALLSWVTRPDASTVATLVRDFSGATWLIPVAALLGWLGCVAGGGARRGRGRGLTLAVVALPWLVLPPALLIAASLAHPVYVERYVMFCLPALSLLMAAGLVWLVKLTAKAVAQRGRAASWSGHALAATATWSGRALAAAPAAAIAVIIVAVLVGPQVQIRQAGARADNLRAVAAVLAAHERPGDAVLYLPWDVAIVGMAYPGPYSRLRDIGLGVSPVASATLRGLPAGPVVLAGRLRGVTRVWTVSWAQPLPLGAATPADVAAQRAVAMMLLIGRWRVASIVLSLYRAG
jgi:mannosyltransferase